MKIVQFITHMHEIGGAQMHVYELALALKMKGHEVTVIGSGSCELTDELYEHNIPYIALENLGVPIALYQDFKAYRNLKQTLQKIQPDLIAIHSSKAGVLGRLVAKSLKIPVVFTAHSWSFTIEQSNLKKKLYQGIEKWIGKRATDGVITVSEFDYDQAVLKSIVAKEKMVVIHNGIPDDVRCRFDNKRQEAPLRLLMIARFAPPKDHALLLKALSKINPGLWTLTFAGDGPLMAESQRLALNLGIGDQVDFIGEDRNIIQRLNDADIFLLISQSEGLPLSVIEAMRAGLPIIASNVGGMKELIQNRVEGLLVPNHQEIPLIQAIEFLLHQPETRRRLGKAARERFLEQFDFDLMFEETTAFYERIIDHKKIKKARGT